MKGLNWVTSNELTGLSSKLTSMPGFRIPQVDLASPGATDKMDEDDDDGGDQVGP